MVLDAKLEERTSENNIGDMTREEIVSSSSLAHASPKVSQTYLLMPCPFKGPKMFCAGPNILSQPKNLTAFNASSKTFVRAQKPILLNANHLFIWRKMFVTATICK